ncbi:alpha-1,4-glucan--maltose-1-phosphate maltosyltransferase [Rhodopila sp.]|uniref:alpha-1,4-glucan--maltose-1-phosphate maltosyltransferase n=1 Tax=Rhodopila sp. TaxID=2480087 RepID=UPI003D0C7190
MLDIAPGQIAINAPLHQRHLDWFGATGSNRIPDPRQPPHRIDIAVPCFDQTAMADSMADWWVKILTRVMQAGIESFRCLTLDLIPAWFWRRITAAIPDALFLAWTPGVPQARELAGIDFSLSASSAAWWDGRAPWFLDELAVLRDVAPALASPEPSFFHRLTQMLAPDADLPKAYRLSLQIAAATGAGLFLPMGFEYATSRRFDPVHARPEDMEAAMREMPIDLSDDVAAAIRLNKHLPIAQALRPVTSPAAPVTALLREDTLVLINPDVDRPATLGFSGAPLPPSAGAALSALGDLEMPLHRGEVRILKCRQDPGVPNQGLELCSDWAESTRIAIEAVEPSGEFASKTVVGREFTISADVFGDGHDLVAADVLWRPADASEWRRVRMQKLPNDRWEGLIRPERVGLYQFAVEAWWDQWGTFTHDLHAKVDAGQDVKLELQEGWRLIQTAMPGLDTAMNAEAMLAEDFAALVEHSIARPFVARSSIHWVRADRPSAEFASWYELFPRSATYDAAVPGTFRSVIERLPDIRRMGFDVLYFPPIHPIGRINRKGRNNSLTAAPGDVGSPYAIGSAEGGHDALNPELGTLDDFRALIRAGQENNLEVAIDFAIQCAPDHPWVKQHKDWFRWRPDGSIRYAENPPKKYEDIVNPDFYGEASFPAVWTALRDVVQFWVDQGVRIFRVDNPHTKPLPFWQWMVADIQGRNPDVLFLAEAFTRPKPMYRLAKAGFSQSYTYFTWRNTKQEITDYLTELTTPPVANFFRPNFFVNTPDINPVFLQTSGRAGFLIRAALAATLSGLWGVYSGFELCEAGALPEREEYLDSEKYEIRPRDYAMPGNIVAEITALNRIRRHHPALQSHLGLKFYNAFNDQIILYGKRDPLDHSMVLVVVSFDPHIAQEAAIEVPLWEFGLPDEAAIAVADLMSGEYFTWHGKHQYIRLDPVDLPFRIWRLEFR